MGCASSKILLKSLSYKEDLNWRKQRSVAETTTVEETSASQKINDHQLLALVRAANTLAKNLRSNSLSSKSRRENVEPELTMTYNTTWEVVSGLEQGEEGKEVEAETPFLLPQTQRVLDPSQRSKSYHLYSTEKENSISKSSCATGEEEEEWNFRGVGRAWSFHTVEEYDAMIERMNLSKEQITSDSQVDDSISKVQPNDESQSSTDLDNDSADTYCKHEGADVEEKPVNEESILPSLEVTYDKHIAGQTSSSSTKMELNVEENPSNGGNVSEKGFKRKSVAKRLESIKVPETVEFQAVASLREWLHSGGQVCSPGSYVTPKFGSYATSKSRMTDESSKTAVFDPELVAAFEQCMLQLEAETETVLQQIQDEKKEKDENS